VHPWETLDRVAEQLTVERALAVYELLETARIRFWVIGGWGVDALLGHVTRAHTDLDILLLLADLPKYMGLTSARSFRRSYTWSENVEIELEGTRYDSAFVDTDPQGAVLDVHVIDLGDAGDLIQLSSDPWPLPPGALGGEGTIAGRAIRCVTAEAQLAMHMGYAVPDKQQEDLARLRALAP
jgi:lincosamide nucleotidyltransferase A/C/D/E